MEKDLKMYMTEEFIKLNTAEEQREFIENLRFLMMADDKDFLNYYSKMGMRKSEFYSVADRLYQLNNLCMLSDFIYQNRQVLLNEVNEIEGQYGIPDFSAVCNIGKETMLSRMFQVMKNFKGNESMVAEESVDYRINTHRLKVYAATSRSGQNIAQVVLQGKWVEQCGFIIGSSVSVKCYENRLIILKDS